MQNNSSQKERSSRDDFSKQIKEKVITKPHEVIMAEKKQSLTNLVKSLFFGGLIFLIGSFFIYRLDFFSQESALGVAFLGTLCTLLIYTLYTRKLIQSR